MKGRMKKQVEGQKTKEKPPLFSFVLGLSSLVIHHSFLFPLSSFLFPLSSFILSPWPLVLSHISPFQKLHLLGAGANCDALAIAK